ncbi:MAG: radical SAM protein [Candidatus Alcyoniella australis]|nr:radical SAM protein [Candidatus Alcyoniella australis]
MRALWLYLDIDSGCPASYNHGVGDVDAVLRDQGHDTSLIYLTKLPECDELISWIDERDPQVVLLPVNSHQWAFARTLSDWIKEQRPQVYTVVGGIHAILIPEQVIEHPAVDFVCIGEGERPLPELFDRLERGVDPHGIEGLWSKRGSEQVRTQMPLLIEDLDELPISDRSIWPMDLILKQNYREITVMGGRGCPYRCTYCANSARMKRYKGKGRFVRMRSPERYLQLVELVDRLYDFKSVFFEDDVFTMDHDWTKRFCELYRERFSYPFTCYARVETVDREIFATLKDAGCEMVAIGVESGNEKLRREVLNRKMSNDDIIRVFRWADEFGIKTWNFNIVGIPGETPQTLEDLFELNKIIRPNRAQVSIFYPYPQTELYDLCKREGFLAKQEQSNYFHSTILNLPTIDPEQVQEAFWRFREMSWRIKAEKEALGIFDFVAELEAASVTSDAPEPVSRRQFNVEGDMRLVLFAHPRSEIAYDVDLPDGAEFRAAIALDPLCLKWGGEGVLFALLVQEDDGPRELWSRYLDPKHHESDRGWQQVCVPLDGLGGRRQRLVLKTQTAPSGDMTGAWSGWGDAHIFAAASE